MRQTAVEKIANRISKKYGMPKPIVIRKRNGEKGYLGLEIRTELPSYEGGNEMCQAITNWYRRNLDTEVIVENQGGCVYFAYIP